jgi:hypothetical protein
MGMTNASMNSQTRQARSLEGATADAAALADGLAEAPVVIQATPAKVVATPKTSDPFWNHCDIPNDHK